MNWDIISVILNFLLGGGLLAVFTVKAKKDQATAETDKIEMDNFRTGADLLMESIVKPLKKELQEVRKEVGRLRRAMEHISDCPHSGQCPVRAELKKDEQQTNTDK